MTAAERPANAVTPARATSLEGHEGHESVTDSPKPPISPGQRDRVAARSMLRWGLLLGLVAAVVMVLVGLLIWGAGSVASIATASVVTTVFFVVGVTGIKFVLGGAAGLSLAGAFVVYIGQLILLAAVFLALSTQGWVHGRAFAAAAVVQALAWQAGLVLGFSRARIPVVELDR